MPPVETVYDPDTGEATATRSLDGVGEPTATISRRNDALGWLIAYIDTDGPRRRPRRHPG